MKRNSIYALIVTIALMLSACGSNSKVDPVDPGDIDVTGAITTELQSITIDKNSGAIQANVTISSTYASSVVATLNNIDITLGGCSLVPGSVSANPDTVTLDTTTPSRDVVLTGTMTDPSCVPTSYQLMGANTLLAEGQTFTETFTTESEDIDPNSIIDGALNSVLTVTDPANGILDINISGVEQPIILHLSEGAASIVGQNVEVVGTPAAGSFFASAVATDENGNATFIYAAPEIIADNSFDVQFCMVDDSTVCDAVTINLTTGTIIPPDNNNTPDIGNDFVNYGLTFTTLDGGNTLGLDERKAYTVSLINKDTQELIPATQVETITIESNKPDVLKLINPNDAIGAAVAKLEITGASNINIYLKADEKTSGLSDIEITINYKNTKGYDRVLSQTYAITIFSGPPTALSITSAGVGYNFEEKWFEHKFLISASDKYSNKINTSPTISASVMAGYAKDSSGERMIYGQNSKTNLGIYANLTGSTAQVELDTVGVAPFSAFNTATLQGVDLSRDFVALFGNVRTYEANGKWEIDSISSASKLILSDTYEGEDYTGIGFAVGHNYRQDLCSSEYLEYQTKVDSTDGTYKLDDEGKTFVTVKFPARYMPGKKVGLLINLISENPETGKQLRGGEVKFTTLRSFEGLSGSTISIPKGTTRTVRHFGIVETGTDDRWFLQNSTFSCSTIESTGLTGIVITDRSNPDDCVRPFVEYTVTAAADADGSLVLSDCQADNEFSF